MSTVHQSVQAARADSGMHTINRFTIASRDHDKVVHNGLDYKPFECFHILTSESLRAARSAGRWLKTVLFA